MSSKFTSKRLLVSIIIFIIIIVAALVAYIIVLLSQPSYIGKDVKLSKVSGTAVLDINSTVLHTLPSAKDDVQTSIHITKYAGNYAQGTMSFSDHSPAQQFMAVKSGDSWKVITHNSGSQLNLPNIQTAKQYQLAKGWYKE